MKMTAEQLAERLQASGKYSDVVVRKGDNSSFKDYYIGFCKRGKGCSRYTWLYEAGGQLWFDHTYSINTGRVSRSLAANYGTLKAIGYFDIELN